MSTQKKTQNQSYFPQYQQEQPDSNFPKSQRKDSNSNKIPISSKYSSNKPYQHLTEKNNNNSSNKGSSRTHEINQRHSNKNEKENNFSLDNKNNHYSPSREDCLLIFQKTYFNFDSKDFNDLKNKLKRALKEDIYNIYYNESLPGITDKIFRFTTNPSANLHCKLKAIKIIADFLFDLMKQQNDKVTNLKLIFVVSESVIEFIKGINNKNINQIIEETNTKIEVCTQNNIKNYRKIEITGSPQNIAKAGYKICEITRNYLNFNNEKILNRNVYSSSKREQNYGKKRSRDQYGIDKYRERSRDRIERYNEGNWNKNYNNNANDKELRRNYNKDRNDFRDMGYKDDFRNRGRFRNYGGRDVRNNNYNNKDYDNYRDKIPIFKNNNYDRRNYNEYYYDKKDNNFNSDKNNNSKNIVNYSDRSFSRKSLSPYHNENRSYNNKYNNDIEWSEDKDYKKDENKNEQYLIKEQNSEKNQNFEQGENKDSDFDNNNSNNNNYFNNLIISNKMKSYDKNYLIANNIENNNFDSYINIENKEEKEINEIEEINSILTNDKEQKDESCELTIYLSDDEINLLNNAKNENDNIWINFENYFQCSIKKIIKIIDNKEISLITFNGTLKQNTFAIYQLQKYLSGYNYNIELSKNKKFKTIKDLNINEILDKYRLLFIPDINKLIRDKAKKINYKLNEDDNKILCDNNYDKNKTIFFNEYLFYSKDRVSIYSPHILKSKKNVTSIFLLEKEKLDLLDFQYSNKHKNMNDIFFTILKRRIKELNNLMERGVNIEEDEKNKKKFGFCKSKNNNNYYLYSIIDEDIIKAKLKENDLEYLKKNLLMNETQNNYSKNDIIAIYDKNMEYLKGLTFEELILFIILDRLKNEYEILPKILFYENYMTIFGDRILFSDYSGYNEIDYVIYSKINHKYIDDSPLIIQNYYNYKKKETNLQFEIKKDTLYFFELKSSSYYIKDDFFDITFNKCLEFTNLYETKNMINKDINKEIMLIYDDKNDYTLSTYYEQKIMDFLSNNTTYSFNIIYSIKTSKIQLV